MGKLSAYSKNENSTDISLYRMYLPKLLENILKFNLFKDIAIGFNHDFQTSEFPTVF